MDDRETRRSDYSLTIPDALLLSDAMRRACETRDFQEIFRLVNRRTGSSHAVMAAAVGKMTSSRVSDIIRGERGIRGQAVIERVCDGFGIPGEMLGVPEQPWEKNFPERGDGEETSPLKRRSLLKSGIVASTLAGLGLDELQHVAAALDNARRYLDGPVVEHFRGTLETAKHDDGKVGARKTLPGPGFVGCD
ncbi:hypothetical protein AB0945_10415 [Streptomyces sp. NPDC005474]|uniref:hypothetical protein n=1 Tax=Streptomyces sp. NPDC005474 TaxID=3154878 RepID=UPI003451CDF5